MNEETRTSYPTNLRHKETLPIHDFARICLLVTKMPDEIGKISFEDKDRDGKSILQILNDTSFAQRYGFTTFFFPNIEPHMIADLVAGLRRMKISELKHYFLE